MVFNGTQRILPRNKDGQPDHRFIDSLERVLKAVGILIKSKPSDDGIVQGKSSAQKHSGVGQ